jgi:Mg/Co/Ni transporter MgtE (contains CBS domain)
MTSEPVVLAPDTTVAQALARVRDPDLTPAVASLVFVTRPPTATPTGRYLGCVHLQRLLREPPPSLSAASSTRTCRPESRGPTVGVTATSLPTISSAVLCRRGNHLLGAVSVDDVLDHLLPDDWREREEPELSGAEGVT